MHLLGDGRTHTGESNDSTPDDSDTLHPMIQCRQRNTVGKTATAVGSNLHRGKDTSMKHTQKREEDDR
jgi:hypothetical protein